MTPTHEAAARTAEMERLSSLGRLGVVMAHEISNPLMLMKMSLRALRQGPVAPEQREAIADLQEQVERATRLVTDVLDFARPLRFSHSTCDVNAVVTSAAAAATAGEPEPRIGLSLDRSLPAIVTDGERLRAALVNVLTNARHAVSAAATPPADRCGIELRTEARPDGGVQIVVRDSGIGISPADLERVFEPYFTTKRAGNGIGLPLTRNIINGLDGTIGLTSQVGVGTEVRIELPARPGAARVLPLATAPCGAQVPECRPCVLVVEDDPGLCTLLATGLHLQGFAVKTAANGAEGLERVRQARPALVLLDLMMPVMDGEQFRQAQLQDPAIADIPVVCISAMDEAAAAKRLRATAYVVKPFDMDQIASVVRTHCRSRCQHGACS